MSGFSDLLAGQVLNHALKGVAMAQPAGLHVALSFTDPGADGTGLVEPSTGDYARVQHDTWTVSGRTASNTGLVQFPQASADWGTEPIAYFAIMDAAVAGNVLVSGALPVTAQQIVSGDIPKFPAGFLKVNLGTAA
jgi:hypothetical protein